MIGFILSSLSLRYRLKKETKKKKNHRKDQEMDVPYDRPEVNRFLCILEKERKSSKSILSFLINKKPRSSPGILPSDRISYTCAQVWAKMVYICIYILWYIEYKFTIRYTFVAFCNTCLRIRRQSRLILLNNVGKWIFLLFFFTFFLTFKPFQCYVWVLWFPIENCQAAQ